MTTSFSEPGHATTHAAVRIEVLHVPNCARLGRVRGLIDRALVATGINGTIEEVVGDHHSPTVLVNGVDVTGRSAQPGAACRLDLPTDLQLNDALMRAAVRGACGTARPR